jgi:hypothetical protein
MYGGLLKIFWCTTNAKISCSVTPIYFSRLNTYNYSPDKEEREGVIVKTMRERYGRIISGGTRVLDMAADNRQAAQGKGARTTSNNDLEVEQTRPRGVEPDIISHEVSHGERSGTV